MCALVTFTSLALAATSAVLLVLATTNGKLKQNLNIQDNYSQLIDPKGPKIQFILFTRNHKPQQLKINETKTYRNSGFNMTNPTKIIIHGFQSSISQDVFTVNKNAYLESGDYNVIGMDWSQLCSTEYFSAIQGVREGGKTLANFLTWLSTLGVNLNQVHIIGHSLGAHIAGIAGSQIKPKLGRITDPAAPGFRETDLKLKLDSSDAKIVDVVHTYMKVLSIAQPMGHIDFYPNGGRKQPGCPDLYEIWQISESLVCNHARAYYLFAESIKNKKAFKSKKCRSFDDAIDSQCYKSTNVYMGQVETYKGGLYYFRTKEKSPFSL